MNEINLIPMYRMEARAVRRRLRAWGWICALYACVLAVVWIGSWITTRGGAQVAGEITELQQTVASIDQERAALRSSMDRASLLLDAAHRTSLRPDWSILMGMVSQLRGDDIVLHDFAVSPVTASDHQEYMMRIGGFGRAPSAVSSLALRLEGCGMFSRVTIVSSTREPFANGIANRFAIECTLVGAEEARP